MPLRRVHGNYLKGGLIFLIYYEGASKKYLLRKLCLSLGLCGLKHFVALMKTEIID